MRVLVCPDKFRGTLTARQAAEAIEHGWHRERPADVLDLAPLADGGEGTLDVLAPGDDAATARIHRRVDGPLGDPVDAELGVRDGGAVVEMARASGLALIAAGRRDPVRATTYGTGQLMLAALEAGVERLLVCLGGSATNDGGVGMAMALGGRFLDATGRDISRGGGALPALARIDLGAVHARWRAVEVIGVTDVDNPLCGPTGASAVFGPQKGADPDDVWELDRALAHLAAVAARDLGADRSREPGAGAAGGLGFGLLAFLGARLRPGIEVVMEAVGLSERLRDADLVITGEGSLDQQSLHGKVPAGVLRAAEEAHVPAAILCGVASIAPQGVRVRSLVERVGTDVAIGDARRSLELLAAEFAREFEGDAMPHHRVPVD
jgi:glycerate kinase